MAGKAKAPMVAYCGMMRLVPYSDEVGSSKRGRNKSFELENTTNLLNCGMMGFVPYSDGVGSNKRGRNKSFELENTTKTAIKKYGGGVSTKFTQKQKAIDFYDKRSGNHGGVMELVPYSGGVGSNKRGKNKSFELENTTKTAIKNYGGVVSTKFTQKHKQKTGDFYDKRSGNHGFKEEVKYESSVKFDDKIHGYSTEYQTEVKIKKVNFNKGAPKSSYKRIKYNMY